MGREAPRLFTVAETKLIIEAVLRGDRHKKILESLPGRDEGVLRGKIFALRKSGKLPPAPKKKSQGKYNTVANPPRDTKPKSNNVKHATRACLGCGDNFESTWIGNRMCAGCKHHKRDYAPYAYEVRL